MFTLEIENSKFYRVKRGQTAEDVHSFFLSPCYGGGFAGEIISLDKKLYRYTVKPLESYASISKKTGTEEKNLRLINGDKILYPTLKIFVPV